VQRNARTLPNAPSLSAGGVASAARASLFFAPVILELSDQAETCRWRAVVGFTQAPLKIALLGIAGGLEFFRSTLDVSAGLIEMIQLPSLPLTQDAVP
jgi:hypothetical protein